VLYSRPYSAEAVDMNGIFQMQGGKNWFLPKETNANRFFWDSHWLEIWSNHFYPSMGPNGGSVAMDSGVLHSVSDQIQNLPNCFTTPTKMTSEDDIKGLVSLKFLPPCKNVSAKISKMPRFFFFSAIAY
jgi:hypothetical protein